MGTAGHGQSMTMLRTLLLALLLALIAAPVASAQGIVGKAADALASDPVYVDPSAERALSDEEADALRRRIQERNAGPLYVAVLPAAAKNEGGGSAQGVAQAIAQRLDRPGTYAVIAGGSFSAGSTDLRGTGDQATAALDEHKSEGTSAVLLDFVDRVGELRAGRSPDSGSGGDGGSGGGSDGGGSGIGAALLLPLLAPGGGALLLSRRRRRQADESELAELKENV